MRRSSRIVLLLALAVLAAALVLYLRTFNSTAPRMTAEEAAHYIARGKAAVERGDADAIMEMISPEARILGRNTEDMRKILGTALSQIRGHLSVKTRNLRFKQSRSTAELTFDLDLVQDMSGVSATYFLNHHFTVKLEKTPATHILGLYRTEEWLIIEIISDPKIETPM